MSDPIDQLEHFTAPALTTDPLPAAEVRRRGTRRRRRNRALAVTGGLAAVAVIATPLAIGATQHRPAPPPQVATQPAPVWIQQIPAGFPLGDGMGTQSDPPDLSTQHGSDVDVLQRLDVCGAQVWDLEHPASTDALHATWSDGTRGGQQRTLALYPSDTAAQAAIAAVREAVASCHEPQPTGDDHILTVALQAVDDMDAVAYADRYDDGGGNAYVLTRVGNALLVAEDGGVDVGSDRIAQRAVDRMQTRASDLAKSLCSFADEAGTLCATSPPVASETERPE